MKVNIIAFTSLLQVEAVESLMTEAVVLTIIIDSGVTMALHQI